MTRPIYEPNLERTDRKLGFGSDQLFRRPTPQGTGTLAIFRAVQTGPTATTIEDNGVYAEMKYDCWENCDANVYEAHLVGGQLATVEILQAGVYSITVRFILDQEWTGNFRIIINDWGDWPGAAFYDFNSLQGENAEAPMFSVIRTYPPPECLDLGPSLPQILIQFSQFGASGNRDLNSFGSSLEIARLGAFSSECAEFT